MANLISLLVSVYDQTAQTFGPPFISPNEGVAIRGFMDAINRPQNPDNDLAQHPEDFDLYVVGQYDATTGRVEPIDPLGKPILQGKQARIQSVSGDTV